MQVHVYFEHWVNQWVAYDLDQQDVDHTGPVVWANTKEEAVEELLQLIEEEKQDYEEKIRQKRYLQESA